MNTAPKPQNIFIMITEKHILIIKNERISYQATHLPFKYYISELGGVGGSRLALIMLTQGGGGGSQISENLLT